MLTQRREFFYILFFTMQFLVYDFRWKDPETCIIWASLGEKIGYKPVQKGDKISLERVSLTLCAGSLVGGEWRPCPEKAQGKPKCEVCRGREKKENLVFTVFDGFNKEHLTPEDLEKIQGEHEVYLALFDQDLIKVGVCQKQRKTLRQLEQGAYATLFIAQTSDGIIARQIETTLRKNGVLDKVLSSQKTSLYRPDLSPEKAQKLLLDFWKKNRSAVELHYQKYLYPKPDFHIWSSWYSLDALPPNTQSIHSIKLQKNEWVSGEIIAIKGSFLFVETDQEIVALNMKDLNGHYIEFDERPSGVFLEKALQGALF